MIITKYYYITSYTTLSINCHVTTSSGSCSLSNQSSHFIQEVGDKLRVTAYQIHTQSGCILHVEPYFKYTINCTFSQFLHSPINATHQQYNTARIFMPIGPG